MFDHICYTKKIIGTPLLMIKVNIFLKDIQGLYPLSVVNNL